MNQMLQTPNENKWPKLKTETNNLHVNFESQD